MLPSWPATLPQFIADGQSYAPLGNAMAIDTEVGAPMTRRRFTGKLVDITGSIVVSLEHMRLFRDWFEVDLKHGTLRFSANDPLFCEAVEMIFRAPPAYGRFGGKYRIDMSLRIVA